MHWLSTDLGWTGSTTEPTSEAARDALPGSAEWARELVWRTLTGVQQVELDMALAGDLEDPSLSVTSNLGEAVAASLQRELGREIEAAEARIRAEVDRQIQPFVQDARSQVDGVRSDVGDRVANQRREIDELRTRLEARIQELIGAAEQR